MPEPGCDVCGSPIGTPGTCISCQALPPAYDRLVSACRFEGLIKDLIQQYKYRHATVYKKFFAEMVHSAVSKAHLSPDILTYVPMHWSRMMQRGYNQSALIARELSGYMGLDVRYGILRKVRKTPSQVGLPRKDRVRNLRSVFSASGVEGRSVMVIDDVVTTGRTASEIAGVLKRAGAERIYFVSVGRTI